MFKIDFKNKKVNFFRLATFARIHKLKHQEVLKQAFDQDLFNEDNKYLLENFIESFRSIKNIQSQLYQDIFAYFVVGDKYEKIMVET